MCTLHLSTTHEKKIHKAIIPKKSRKISFSWWLFCEWEEDIVCGYKYIRLSKVQALKKKINKVVPRGGGAPPLSSVCVKSISQLQFLFTESWKQLFLHTPYTKKELKQALFYVPLVSGLISTRSFFKSI